MIILNENSDKSREKRKTQICFMTAISPDLDLKIKLCLGSMHVFVCRSPSLSSIEALCCYKKKVPFRQKKMPTLVGLLVIHKSSACGSNLQGSGVF